MPTRSDLRRALEHIKRRADYEYFFSRLTSPEWLGPMIEEHLFDRPPAATHAGDYIQFPSWPEAEYLVRVAGDAPEAAASVLMRIPETDNLFVHQQLVDAALKLPAEKSAEWALREATWLRKQRWLAFLLAERYAELAATLAKGGRVDTAISLVEALFELVPQPEAADQSELRQPRDPRGKVDAWEYSQALDIVVEALANTAGLDAIAVFSRLLRSALQYAGTSEGTHDYSSIWRDEIEDNAEERDVRNALVSAVRDAAEVAAKAIDCAELVATIEAHGFDVFRRLALNLIRVVCPERGDLVRPRLLSREAFGDPAIHHEYAMLLQASFTYLSADEQRVILGWIETGGDREGMRRRHRAFSGEELTPELEEAWVEQWQRDRLSPIRDSLPAEWRRRFNAIVERYGPPEFDFVQHKTSVSWGARSPITADRMRGLNPDEIRRFLADWTPDSEDEPRRESREGLVNALQSLGDEFFEQEAANATKWRELHPSYVATFLSALERAVRAGKGINWHPVLELCQTFVETRRDETDWLARSIASLLTAGLDADQPARIPQSAGDVTWNTIERLVGHPQQAEPDLQLSDTSDDLTTAINTVSGKALETVIRFAVWRKRDAAFGEWSLSGSLPAVDRVLNEWLDPAQSIVSVRSIFGLQLGPLMWLDRDWVLQHKSALFPGGPSERAKRDAVWNTHLLYGRAFGQTLEDFGDQYAFSVEGLANQGSAHDEHRAVNQHLAEHLAILYWQGVLQWNRPDRLLEHFFGVASLELRGYMMDFIGRALRRDQDVPSEPIARLRDLVERRIGIIEHMERDQQKVEAVELASFGWWFATGLFESGWSLKILSTVLRLAGEIEPDHMVAERLLEILPDHAPQIADVLHQMVVAPREYHTIASWRDEARAILRRLLTLNDARVRQRAIDTINALLERRFHDFRDLLPSAGTEIRPLVDT